MMPKIPSANIEIAAVYANCPTCGESFEATEDGSMLISMHNFKPEQIGQIATCVACGQQYRLPASIRRVFR
jgi:uncharacterized protein with PIN domain